MRCVVCGGLPSARRRERRGSRWARTSHTSQLCGGLAHPLLLSSPAVPQRSVIKALVRNSKEPTVFTLAPCRFSAYVLLRTEFCTHWSGSCFTSQIVLFHIRVAEAGWCLTRSRYLLNGC